MLPSGGAVRLRTGLLGVGPVSSSRQRYLPGPFFLLISRSMPTANAEGHAAALKGTRRRAPSRHLRLLRWTLGVRRRHAPKTIRPRYDSFERTPCPPPERRRHRRVLAGGATEVGRRREGFAHSKLGLIDIYRYL